MSIEGRKGTPVLRPRIWRSYASVAFRPERERARGQHTAVRALNRKEEEDVQESSH